MSFTHLPLSLPIAVALEALPHKKFSDYGMKDSEQYAGIILEKTGRHVLVLGDKFHQTDDEHKAHILKHEYTHLAFGHPLQISLQKLNGLRFNVAADAWINEVSPHKLTEDLGGITYTKLRKAIPELPEFLIDPLAIYRMIKVEEIPVNGMDTLECEELSDSKAKGQAALEVLEARATMREAANNGDEFIDRMNEAITAGYKGSSHKYSEVKIAAWLDSIYRQVDRLARQKQGDLVRRRGWRRPGRLPGMAGSARRPSLHVMLALDVSGSTGTWWADLIAATRGLCRYHTVYVVCHSDTIVFQGNAIPVDAPVGGGTCFKPVCEVAQRVNPDCLIWVTDGESADHPTLPNRPIFWVWLPGSRKWALRDGDFQVDYETAQS